MCKKKILIADDNPGCLEVTGLILKSWNFEVMAASSGEEAISLVDPFFYAVILDMHMGEARLTGNDVAKIIKGVNLEIITVLLYSPYKILPKPEFFNGILEKPIKIESLLEALNVSR